MTASLDSAEAEIGKLDVTALGGNLEKAEADLTKVGGEYVDDEEYEKSCTEEYFEEYIRGAPCMIFILNTNTKTA